MYKEPTGDKIASIFKEVIRKYSNFYLFGLYINEFEPVKEHCANFLGEINEQMTNMFLQDQFFFVYYNDALED